MTELKPEVLGPAMGMVVHDLRNPAATLRANLSFVREVAEDASVPGAEVQEALEDAQLALTDLMRGLDQLSWIGRWIHGQEAASTRHEDARESVKRGLARVPENRVELQSGEEPLPVRGGDALSRLVELLVVNGLTHGGPGPVRVHVGADPADVHIEVSDQGRALARELEEGAWTLAGQPALKSRSDGRYSRVLGLFSAKLLADALGASLEATGTDGHAVFRVTLPR